SWCELIVSAHNMQYAILNSTRKYYQAMPCSGADRQAAQNPAFLPWRRMEILQALWTDKYIL
ncbi:hypothetical protein, partial [Komagataeibacter melomenusus]|uniref:hypothetical protein n=1 Tax=Komagataeibacter melomenusus TaxID=2766578 RepID=UPI0019D5FB5A